MKIGELILGIVFLGACCIGVISMFIFYISEFIKERKKKYGKK